MSIGTKERVTGDKGAKCMQASSEPDEQCGRRVSMMFQNGRLTAYRPSQASRRTSDLALPAKPEKLQRTWIETRSLPALTHVLPPIRPLGFPIYVARRPAAPFARCSRFSKKLEGRSKEL
jgi:hypothetical protein